MPEPTDLRLDFLDLRVCVKDISVNNQAWAYFKVHTCRFPSRRSGDDWKTHLTALLLSSHDLNSIVRPKLKSDSKGKLKGFEDGDTKLKEGLLLEIYEKYVQPWEHLGILQSEGKYTGLSLWIGSKSDFDKNLGNQNAGFARNGVARSMNFNTIGDEEEIFSAHDSLVPGLLQKHLLIDSDRAFGEPYLDNLRSLLTVHVLLKSTIAIYEKETYNWRYRLFSWLPQALNCVKESLGEIQNITDDQMNDLENKADEILTALIGRLYHTDDRERIIDALKGNQSESTYGVDRAFGHLGSLINSAFLDEILKPLEDSPPQNSFLKVDS